MSRVEPSFFFDLDGTLTDPKRGITGCVQYALEKLGEAVPSQDELTWCIGPPLQSSFAKLVGSDLAEEAVRLYRERYTDVGLYENTIYAGIDVALAELVERGSQLYVASSKPHVYVNRILEHFGLAQYFDAVFGSELDGTRTDKIELLAHALNASGAAAPSATMVGDRGFDAVGAGQNRMQFLGVLYGYGSLEELRGAGATRWIRSPGEIVEALREDSE